MFERLTDPDFITAIAALISALSWPSLIAIALWLGRNEIAALVRGIESLTLPDGSSVKFRRAVDRAVQETMKDQTPENNRPTEKQIRTAERIGQYAQDTELSVIRAQVASFASEYERVRATMESGDERTRRMEAVTSKMRTLAIAALPLLDELSAISSPGHRLAAVAILQVRPDARFLTWLAERFAVETPFVSYHAGVALLTAARMATEENKATVLAAVRLAKQHLGSGKEKTDRQKVLDDAERELAP